MRDLEKYKLDYLQINAYEQSLIEIRNLHYSCILNQRKFKSVLEVGCGWTPLVASIEYECEYTIVEPVKDFLEVSINDRPENVQLTALNSNLEEAREKLKNKKFDFIVISSLLHELENPKGALESIKEICKNSTVVCINTPNSKSLHRLLGVKLGLLESVEGLSETGERFQRSHEFDISSLTKLVEDCSFITKSVVTKPIKPLSNDQMTNLLELELINESTLSGLEELTSCLPGHGAEIYIECGLK